MNKRTIDGNKLLSNVSSKYGAPMGRRDITDNRECKVRLFLVLMEDDAYDKGGAYWGMGTPLYCAIGDDFQIFRRARDRESAKRMISEEFPKLRFYR